MHEFRQPTRASRNVFKGLYVAVLVAVVGFWGAAVYTAAHFIAKFW